MAISTKSNLMVFNCRSEDFYKDLVRIGRNRRGNIREGDICRLDVGGISKILVVRGIRPDDPTHELALGIQMDALTREELNLELNHTYDFEISPVGIFGHIKWACSSADPGSRIAAWIGVSGFLLGIVALLLGVWSIVLAYEPPR